MRFKAKVAGTAVGVRYYKPRTSKASTPESATLWSKSGKLLARTKLTPGQGHGLEEGPLRRRREAHRRQGLRRLGAHRDQGDPPRHARAASSKAKSNAQLRAPGDSNGVTRPGSKARFPSQRGPGATPTTGSTCGSSRRAPGPPRPRPRRRPRRPPRRRPAGGPVPTTPAYRPAPTLTPYTGPCTITSAAHPLRRVDAHQLAATRWSSTPRASSSRSPSCRGVQSIYGDGDSSVTITDSDVRAGAIVHRRRCGATTSPRAGSTSPAASTASTATTTARSPTPGCTTSTTPTAGATTTTRSSPTAAAHMVVRHNTLHCTAILNSTDGGCTADVSLFGDFDPIDDVDHRQQLPAGQQLVDLLLPLRR